MELTFNDLAKKFLTEFSEEDISVREMGGKEFDYVDPEKYRRRLLSIAEQGFFFDQGPVSVVSVGGKDVGISGSLRLTVEDVGGGPKYDVTVQCMEEFQ